MAATKKPIGMLIMILALVLVAVILVIVIVASSGGGEDTTESTTTTAPITTTAPTTTDGETTVPSTTVAPPVTTVPTTTQKPVDPIKPTLTETTQKADESGKVILPSASAASGVLINVSTEHPYTYDLENIFKGDHETSQDEIAASDYKRLVSASDVFVTPGWSHYVRKETYNALLAMITTFSSHSGTSRALQISGYTASMSNAVTSPFITGNVITILGYSGGTLGLNYGVNKVTVDGVSMTYDKWFAKYAQSYGFFYEGLVGDDDNHLSGKLRYVGSIHAAGVAAAGSLSAYLDGIKGGTITTATASDGSTWNLSYVAASAEENTEITVGANATYTVSGDNMGGFIVAVLAK
ncbi:MAG: hypothetical protein IJW46_05595 [Clostridia bacterium]|nr:hypothetical protein [Clostridia bacterium]